MGIVTARELAVAGREAIEQHMVSAKKRATIRENFFLFIQLPSFSVKIRMFSNILVLSWES